MKKIAIITYDVPHLKTEQLVCSLVQGSDCCFTLICIPFVERKKRKIFFKHRPCQSEGMLPQKLAEIYKLKLIHLDLFLDTQSISLDYDYFLIGGAGLLPNHFIHGKKIINAHAGLTPAAKGLDAFKWSILNNIPLGITMHFIDEGVDSGKIIAQLKTPILKTDTLDALARRHYENEISMLSKFDRFINAPEVIDFKFKARAPKMRMPFEKEKTMVEHFEIYKDEYGI